MKDINELVAKLKMVLKKEDKEEAFETTIKEIEKYYKENLRLDNYEVAIFLANEEKTILSFACPEYLVNSGMIPVSSTEAFTASIFRSGRNIIENNFQQQKHLGIFEIIRTPEGKILPIWKMIGAAIEVENERIGVIEISRRGVSVEDAGEDFTEKNLLFLEKTINILAPFIKKVMPENFRGKIT
ncbi:MAG: hypothetical protein GTO45_03880 [Candidatus Aminicenantes bacterium]|nr:hypothetical protein [Candidatus Aminicenantes bacterium]NIM77867.1 hypothetical protein [Candidatus Aminicenantes bacterium]NIN17180.1 hypothetical protein [Candidatus Aminicenantes bacterium]NIN41073.1 hypothetical protein [Candidatus Aminicenantes bacterium]NIN83878.1 hypothetical protein [Candidatus Aminicenantes bacterium]